MPSKESQVDDAPVYTRIRKAPAGSRYPPARGDSIAELKLTVEALNRRIEALEQWKFDQINN